MPGIWVAIRRGRPLYWRTDSGFCLLLAPVHVRILDHRGLYFWFQLERHWSWNRKTPAPTLEGDPLISILIPCFNEERNARETIGAALAQRYPNIEVIAINDGSSDNTAQVLQQLAQEQPRLRVIHLAENQGKPWR